MAIRSRETANKLYKYVHTKDEYLRTSILGISYNHPDSWLEIMPDGTIHINASCKDGYAWDGCTPKWIFLDFLMGVPDGRLDYLTEKPLTYYGSMLHDLLYQFKSDVPVSRSTADKMFCIILRDSGFKWWWVYYAAVFLFGGLFGKWKTKQKVKDIRIVECSWIEEALHKAKTIVQQEIKDHPYLVLSREKQKA